MALLSRAVRWLICCFMFSLSSVICPFELFYFPLTLFFRSTSAGCSGHNCRYGGDGEVKGVCGWIIGETRGDVLHLPSRPLLPLPVGVLASGPLSFLGDRGWKLQREASAMTPVTTFHLRVMLPFNFHSCAAQLMSIAPLNIPAFPPRPWVSCDSTDLRKA